jgi:polysaccharide export outer membrane protein
MLHDRIHDRRKNFMLNSIFVFTGLAIISGTALLIAGETSIPNVESVMPASGPAYILGPDDQIVIHAFKAEELSEKPVSIGADGLISLPLVGTVQAGGLSVRELEKQLAARLAEYVQHPSVSISVTEYRSQPVSVLGDVNTAGVHELRGETSLLRMISLAGGLKPDAGYRIKIVRRAEWGPIPVAGAAPDSTGKFSVAEVNVKDLIDARRPEDNITIKPYDVITVPKAEMVYVIGEVNKAGAFVLNERATISVLQALSRAEGPKFSAATHSARILRTRPGNPDKAEIKVDVAGILKGSAPDVSLYPEDVLFIPNNTAKNWGLRTIEAMISIGTGVAIYRP